jgi:hypothetical protein
MSIRIYLVAWGSACLAPRRNLVLKAGALPQNQALAKVLRRSETKRHELGNN